MMIRYKFGLLSVLLPLLNIGVYQHKILAKKRSNTMAMTVEIKGNKLCIEIDLEKPTPSSSGKTLVVASSRGNATTTAMVDGKPVIIGLNAYIKP